MKLILAMVLLTGCLSKDKLEKTLVENPDILTKAIEANPEQFMETLQKVATKAREQKAKQKEEDDKKKLETAFENPTKMKLRKGDFVRGVKGAPIQLVEFSDFQCPYCARAFEATISKLLEKYKGKIEFYYRHLPLNFHPQAKVASQYFEAIGMQSPAKAWKFHDMVYESQPKLRNGEAFLKGLAKKLGVNMGKLAKDIKSDFVNKRITEDLAMAEKLGFRGTPGFLLNGVPVKGAYPLSHFEYIIGELQKRGKLKI